MPTTAVTVAGGRVIFVAKGKAADSTKQRKGSKSGLGSASILTAEAEPVGSPRKPANTITNARAEVSTPSTTAGQEKARKAKQRKTRVAHQHQHLAPAKVSSPINVQCLAHHLKVIDYPKDKTDFLIQGFTHGFFLGDPLEQTEASDISANNSKMATDHPEVVEMK